MIQTHSYRKQKIGQRFYGLYHSIIDRLVMRFGLLQNQVRTKKELVINFGESLMGLLKGDRTIFESLFNDCFL